MIQSLTELQRVDTGFEDENVFTARISLPVSEYTEKEQAWAFFDQLHERLMALPGAEAVSLSNIVPLQGNSWEQIIVPEGVPFDQEHWESVLFHMVKPDHFEALGIELVRGAAFTEVDRDDGPLVCVIDETMAEKFWPGEDPIGKRVAFEITEDSDFDNPVPIYRTVVGVARNVRHYELESPSRVQVYVPFNQSGRAWSNQMFVLVKTRDDPLQLTQLVREEVSALHADVPLHSVQTLQDYVREAMAGTRSTGSLLALFSTVALLLSAIGIFGVMSFSVVQRVREIGIRMALGASSSEVLRMISRHGLILGGLGIGLGLLTALALTRLLAGLLYQVATLSTRPPMRASPPFSWRLRCSPPTCRPGVPRAWIRRSSSGRSRLYGDGFLPLGPPRNFRNNRKPMRAAMAMTYSMAFVEVARSSPAKEIMVYLLSLRGALLTGAPRTAGARAEPAFSSRSSGR
jgi:putative ABC transport system permease protein